MTEITSQVCSSGCLKILFGVCYAEAKALRILTAVLVRCCVLLSTLPSVLSGFSFLDLRRAA